MKETVNVNIASEAFLLDTDAYRTLRNYFDDIRRRLPEDEGEAMADIEARMAELFRERVGSTMRVVTLDMVRAAMNRMGTPDDFGQLLGDGQAAVSETPREEPRRLYRSRADRSIAGICGGLAEFFAVDVTLLRLITLLLILFGGLSIWVYILLWIVIPEAPAPRFDLYKNNQKK